MAPNCTLLTSFSTLIFPLKNSSMIGRLYCLADRYVDFERLAIKFQLFTPYWHQ